MASSLKFIVLLALAATAVVVHGAEENQEKPSVQSAGPSNDLILGRRVDGDKLVVNVPVKESASIVGKKVIVKKTFEVGNKEITYIKALDRATKNGASVELVSGGLGQDSVTLRFKSQRFHGIDFSVQLYAKDEE